MCSSRNCCRPINSFFCCEGITVIALVFHDRSETWYLSVVIGDHNLNTYGRGCLLIVRLNIYNVFKVVLTISYKLKLTL